MKESGELLPKSCKSEALATYRSYIKELELWQEDLGSGKSICVIGAGDNSFAYGFRKMLGKYSDAFVMGVDPSEKRYHQLDPHIINHDARDLGFPESFGGFDVVVAYHSVPKYFFAWGVSDKARRTFIESGETMYDYTVADRAGSDDEICRAVRTSLGEMLRITKPGGKVKLNPVEKSLQEGKKTENQMTLEKALEGLQKEYPGLTWRYFRDQQSGLAKTLGKVLRRKPKEYIHCGLEIIRPPIGGENEPAVIESEREPQ